MSGEIDRTTRIDMSISFDVGACPAILPDDPLIGGTFSLMALVPQNDNDTPSSARWGARFDISYFSVGYGHEFIDLTPREEGAETAPASSPDSVVNGMRTYMGLELSIPLDIVFLRLSPGAVIKYDDRNGADYGAAVAISLMIDLPASAFLLLNFTSDVYTRNRTELFMGGLGFGFTL